MNFFIERPVATAMIFMALLVTGVYSFLNTPIELAPKEDYPRLDIQTTWSGVPPEIIQTEITAPLEEIASTVQGVTKINSQSSIGTSKITLEFHPKTNMEFAGLALREAISKEKTRLPYGVRPQVQPYVPQDFRTNPFLSYTISGDYSLHRLREIVKEKVEFGLGSVKGVSMAEITGGADPEIRVVLDREKLKSLNMHAYEVYRALIDRFETHPAGKITKGSQEYIFKVSDSVGGLGELNETVVSYTGRNPVKLRDAAQVMPSYGEIFHINRINGQPTVLLTILKEKGMNTLKVAGEVKKKLELIKRELPRDLTFKAVHDESEDIRKNIQNLSLLVGVILLIIFVIIFLVLRSFKPSLLILSSIVFSVLITFNLIYIFKISMNMLTLGALALGFGLFVDNSIVVFENVLRLRERGQAPLPAALQGAKEVFLPVLSSTLTTISVFFSFAYFQGRLKIYYLPLAIVISCALAASLLVSFSLIPALSPGLIRLKRKEPKEILRSTYEKFLKFLLRHPVEIVLIVAAVFYGSYKWFRSEVTIGEFFRWYYKERLIVYIGMPPGSDIEQTDIVVEQFEEKVLQAEYEKEMNTNIMAENAYISITFPPEVENSFHPYLLKEELIQLATNFAGISIGISGFDPQGYYSSMTLGTFYDSRIKFYGYNLKKLKEITSDLEQRLKQNPRIKDVKTVSSRFGWRVDSFEHILKIDKEKLKKYDIDSTYLFFHLQSLVRGRFGAPLKGKIGGKERTLTVKFPEAEVMDTESLQDILIQTRGGEYLRLGEISSLEERPIAGSIDRENQQYEQTVMWEFRGPTKAADNFKKAVFAGLQLPPGFSASLEEAWRWMTEEEKGQFRFAIIFSLIIIFIILASLYESLIHPFFIMLAVPLALIGVFVAFIIADYPFDSTAYVGVLLLGGIVVNNSILLVDHISLRRRQGLSLLEAVLTGAKERIRPIFMTTSTTVLGMLPLLLIQAEAGKRQIWSSLALCTVGGLVTSTIFILIVIPIFYFYGDRIRYWAYSKAVELKKAREKF